MSYGLGGVATALRREIADFIAAHPSHEISGTPVEQWVAWDCSLSVAAYADKMRTGSQWGGAIEMAICAAIRSCAVHVYEKKRGSYKRISCFDAEGARKKTAPKIRCKTFDCRQPPL